MQQHFDVIVIGAGHAGCEAAHAAARIGAQTLLITMDMNKIAQMSCNPAVGGIAKGQIVREIDAMGGAMGRVTDACTLQFRMLNRSKGPAMWSPRAQCDRGKFIWAWREVLENTPNLHIWQDQVRHLLTDTSESSRGERGPTEDRISSPQGGREGAPVATGVETYLGMTFYAKSIILTAGTFLNGLMHIGRVKLRSLCRTALVGAGREHRPARHPCGSHEDGHPRPHRCPQRRFLPHDRAARRHRR